MFVDSHVFVAWEEHIISQEKGNRIVHFYLKDGSGNLVLAVVGTERSIRHMIYVVTDEFLQAYGSEGCINACTKWRARREVVDWLGLLVSKHHPPLDISSSQTNHSKQALGSCECSMAGTSVLRTHDQMIQVPRKLKIRSSDIVWSGVGWTCCKQLKHYPAFCRNEITIAVHSFVFIMAEEESHYLGYLEDLYDDKKGQKKVKVRWFHRNQEVNGVVPQQNPHPREVFITPHVQVISAECINGPATVLSPKHYEKYLAVFLETLSSGPHLCSRQIKNNRVRPFSLSKLRGYFNQAILSFLISTPKTKDRKSNSEEEEEFKHKESMGQAVKRYNENPMEKCQPTYKKLRIKLSRTGAIAIKVAEFEPQDRISFKVDEKVELLCQDSGIRGCWFRCKVLQVSQKRLKVQYIDVMNVDEETGNLEEWVPACKVAACDKLGLRCSDRLTIRPLPTEDSSDCSLEVGVPVDAWWSDGWWEGVVTGVNIPETDSLQVYCPGEDRFLTIEKKNIRKSRDWVGNRWMDVKVKPDMLSCIPSIVSPTMNQQKSSILAEAPEHGGSEVVDHEVRTSVELEAVEEDKLQLPGPGTSDSAENVESVNLEKISYTSLEDKMDEGCESGGDEAKSFLEDGSDIAKQNLLQ